MSWVLSDVGREDRLRSSIRLPGVPLNGLRGKESVGFATSWPLLGPAPSAAAPSLLGTCGLALRCRGAGMPL